MMYINKIVVFTCIVPLLLSCFATRPCSSKFVNNALKNENILREACEYIQNNLKAVSDVKVFGLDSIQNNKLKQGLKALNIGSIYIHNKESYSYTYPQENTIAFSKTYTPMTNKHELIVFSFKRVDTLRYQDFKNKETGETLCRMKPDIYYYSY